MFIYKYLHIFTETGCLIPRYGKLPSVIKRRKRHLAVKATSNLLQGPQAWQHLVVRIQASLRFPQVPEIYVTVYVYVTYICHSVCVCIYLCAYIYIYIHIIYIYTYIHIYIYIYIYICTHTHTHTHTHILHTRTSGFEPASMSVSNLESMFSTTPTKLPNSAVKSCQRVCCSTASHCWVLFVCVCICKCCGRECVALLHPMAGYCHVCV